MPGRGDCLRDAADGGGGVMGGCMMTSPREVGSRNRNNHLVKYKSFSHIGLLRGEGYQTL